MMRGRPLAWILLTSLAPASTGCIALLAEKPIRVGPKPLAGTRWLLQTVDGASVPVDTESTLAFDSSGTISGNGGCNDFTAGVDISGDALLPGALHVEGAPCDAALMALQSRYFAALADTARYEAGDSYLLLLDDQGRQRLGLSRLLPPSP